MPSRPSAIRRSNASVLIENAMYRTLLATCGPVKMALIDSTEPHVASNVRYIVYLLRGVCGIWPNFDVTFGFRETWKELERGREYKLEGLESLGVWL